MVRFVGLCHFNVTIEKSESSKSEIRDDMEKIFSKICSKDDAYKVYIPDFYKYVQQITPDEERLYEKIQDFSVDDVK